MAGGTVARGSWKEVQELTRSVFVSPRPEASRGALWLSAPLEGSGRGETECWEILRLRQQNLVARLQAAGDLDPAAGALADRHRPLLGGRPGLVHVVLALGQLVLEDGHGRHRD